MILKCHDLKMLFHDFSVQFNTVLQRIVSETWHANTETSNMKVSSRFAQPLKLLTDSTHNKIIESDKLLSSPDSSINSTVYVSCLCNWIVSAIILHALSRTVALEWVLFFSWQKKFIYSPKSSDTLL